MGLFEASLIILLLIVISAVISSAEISLAGARKLKLQAMVNEGDLRAEKVMKLQEQPGRFITVVQIGLNMVAILGGVVGESAINPYFSQLFSQYTQAEWVDRLSLAISLREDEDPRVEGEVERLINEIEWKD